MPPGVIASHHGDLDKTRRLAEGVVESHPTQPGTLSALAGVMARRGDLAGARDYLRAGLR